MNKEKLYEAFGELIYAVAMADGMIQKDETTALTNILKDHAWASDIQWSFNYELKKEHKAKDAYKKALYTFQEYGPAPEYEFLFEILEAVGGASETVDSQEADIIYDTMYELNKKFREDMEKGDLL